MMLSYQFQGVTPQSFNFEKHDLALIPSPGTLFESTETELIIGAADSPLAQLWKVGGIVVPEAVV
jgi:hypothetical protein